MNDINKDELLDVKKWQRLFFMVIYAAAANFIIGIVLFLIFLQFIFYLFTSNINDQLKSANNWLKDFLIDSLNFWVRREYTTKTAWSLADAESYESTVLVESDLEACVRQDEIIKTIKLILRFIVLEQYSNIIVTPHYQSPN